MKIEKHMLTVATNCRESAGEWFYAADTRRITGTRTLVVFITGSVTDYIQAISQPELILYDLDCTDWRMSVFVRLSRLYKSEIIRANGQ